MKRIAFATVACLALLVLAASGAFADAVPPQVTLSSGTNGSVVFTGAGSSVSVDFTGHSTGCPNTRCVSGAAILDLGTGLPGSQIPGNYWMWIVGGPITLMGGPSDYTVTASGTIYLDVKLGSSGSLGNLLTTVSLQDLTGGSGRYPQFDGTFLTSISTLDFKSLFPATIEGTIDYTVKLPLNSGFGPKPQGSSVSGYISSGEVDSPVPEPGTLGLLGTGILGLAGLIRRKI